ncbi:MAG TPA: DCC1-like thiol-disulfide oxidoreductase family protein [Chthonomonadaceae bacterium]|nr:DCC1-like thiol-disulfide oxidoreductase family protein [Chthonomonadaceae bacterium]
MTETQPIALVLFDGVCNLCNRSVQFIIRNDPGKRFRFASLQSPAGQEVQQRFHLPPDALDSVLLLENDRLYNRSTAALRIARRLRGLWPLLSVLLLVPRPLRDWAYNLIAKNRYRLFGKRDVCMLPTPELKDRFINN